MTSNQTKWYDKTPAIKSSKIFSLPNQKGATLPVLETVSPDGSLFSINLVSCVRGHIYEGKNYMYSHMKISLMPCTVVLSQTERRTLVELEQDTGLLGYP